MFTKLRSSKFSKVFAILMILAILNSLISPSYILAITSGPSQPESTSFEPIGTTDMVDLFTGDFNYNIPLFELPGPDGGYPFNLAYHSGIGMEQEASWVGLGWNINPGAINRSLRNLPDEFDGTDMVTMRKDMKNNYTIGGSLGHNFELFGLSLPGSSLSVGIYYNHFKGMGYNVTAGYNGAAQMLSKFNGDGLTASIGLSVSLDSQEGVGVSPAINIAAISKEKDSSFKSFGINAGAGYNSRSGLTGLSLGWSVKSKEYTKLGNAMASVLSPNEVFEKILKEAFAKKSCKGGSSSLATAQTSFSPSVGDEYNGLSLRFDLKGGVSWGLMADLKIGAFYNNQWLENRDEDVLYPAVGYLNLEKEVYWGTSETSELKTLYDFVREKDGPIRKTSSNLAIPSNSYDVYSVAGQGIGNMFRPYRSDFGVVHDMPLSSEVLGGSVGLEYGAPTNGGCNIGLNGNFNKSHEWYEDGDTKIGDAFEFKGKDDITKKDYEPYWFQTYGEHCSDNLANELNPGIYKEEAVNVQITKNGGKLKGTNKLIGKNTNTSMSRNYRKSRKARTILNTAYTNDEISTENGEIIMPEFKIDELPNRTAPGHHHAGFISTNAKGVRYVYALPAYNIEQTDYLFSVESTENKARVDIKTAGGSNIINDIRYDVSVFSDNKKSDNYFQSTNIPEYPYAYLLTSVLGPDYIDITGDGISPDDIGYYVKFNYEEHTRNAAGTQTPYCWRAPYYGANAVEGFESTCEDDKAAFLYGKKEIWYLKSVETSTHIAIFETNDDRTDGRGATVKGAENNAIDIGDMYNNTVGLKKLDRIELYSKAEYFVDGVSGTVNPDKVAIKEIHFEYAGYNYDGNDDFELCQGVHNSLDGGGKLTLKKVYFEYKNNGRGQLNPYIFGYGTNDQFENPDYNPFAVDRWGNYKELDGTTNEDYNNKQEPYVDQIYANTHEEDANKLSAAWTLKKITLPSGGVIDVTYESDRYAYVQDKQAMRLFKIFHIENGFDFATATPSGSIHQDKRKVYFEFEDNLPSSAFTSAQAAAEAKKYISPGDDLLFKIKLNLGEENMSPYWETVSGYIGVNSVGAELRDGFWYGYVELKDPEVGSDVLSDFHPFAFGGYQFLRTNRPSFIYTSDTDISGNLSNSQKIAKTKNFFQTIGTDFSVIFKGIYNYLDGKQMCEEIDLDHSFIRLKEPDKEKFGGGCRVKELKFHDNWNTFTDEAEADAEYGQVYDYTMMENGELISSGVASYEPIVGSEENPFKYAKNFVENIKLKTNNALFWEGPANENLMPAPVVGYRKVTVKSLTTNAVLESGSTLNTQATGVNIHEFYTAKDFPVILDQTDLKQEKTVFDRILPIIYPPFGETMTNKLAATQGYMIILNDMHGKLRKTSSYGLFKDDNGVWKIDYETLVSSNEIFYNREHNASNKGALNNKVSVIVSDNDPDDPGKPKVEKRDVGVDYEFAIDTRMSKSEGAMAGLALNAEVLFCWPAVYPVPFMSYTNNTVKTVVTNKIIHKSGIVRKTVAYNGSSKSETNTLLYDALTGVPLLSTVTNEYEKPVYHYQIPAHFKYDKMDAAYKNIGVEFEASLSVYNGPQNLYELENCGSSDLLVEGDEFIVSANPDYSGESYKLVLSEIKPNPPDGTYLLHYNANGSIPDLTNLKYFKIIRSGRKNLLEPTIENIVSLEDPTKPLAEVCTLTTCTINTTSSNPICVMTPCATKFWEDFQYLINNQLDRFYGHHPSLSPPSDVDRDITEYCFHPDYALPPNNLDLANYEDPQGDLYFGMIPGWGSTIAASYNWPSTPEPTKIYTGYVEDISGSTEELHHMIGWQLVDPDNNPINGANIVEVSDPHVSPGWLMEGHWDDGNDQTFEHDDGSNIYFNYTLVGESDTVVHTGIIALAFSGDYIYLPQSGSDIETNTDYVTIYVLDGVIDISAKKLTDTWFNNSQGVNLFQNGEEGKWSTMSNYVYNTSRFSTTVTSTNNISKEESGLMNDVTMFSWDYPLTLKEFDCGTGKWIKVDETMKINSNSNILETRDALGVYSCTLYGYGEKLPVAVIGNSRIYECGFASFEEIKDIPAVNQGTNVNGNLDFYSNGSPFSLYDEFEVVLGIGPTAFLNVDYPINPNKVKLFAYAYADATDEYEFESVTGWYNTFGANAITPSTEVPANYLIYLPGYGPEFKDSDPERNWYGKIGVKRDVPAATANNSGLSIIDTKAHSGNQCLMITTQPQPVEFKQHNIRLQKNEEYLISFWVSVPSIDSYTYENSGFNYSIGFFDENGSQLCCIITSNYVGDIIEGWQKVDAVFTVPPSSDGKTLSLGFNPGTNAEVYIDDIRIIPSDAQMVSYVYDKVDYKLRAELDNNNYATFYYYDSEGNLFLIKKETERGIKTIQESKVHMKNTGN